MTAPLVDVVEHRRENRSERLQMPDGTSAFLCGVIVSVDRLACGHTVEIPGGGRAKRRRCQECAAPRLVCEPPHHRLDCHGGDSCDAEYPW